MTRPVSFLKALKTGFAVMTATLLMSAQVKTSAQQSAAVSVRPSKERQFLERYCATCHNDQAKSGGLSLVQVDLSKPGAQAQLWEKVVRKLRTGVMPPPNAPQPSGSERLGILKSLETSLDAASAAKG